MRSELARKALGLAIGLLAGLTSASASTAADAAASSAPDTSVRWSLGHPLERLRVPMDRELEFTVRAEDKPVRGLSIVQSTLQDASTLRMLPAGRLEVRSAAGSSDHSLDVPAHSTRRFRLVISPDFDGAGVFVGDVSFAIAGQPESQSFRLTVFSRPPWAWLIALGFMLAGLLAYFWINVIWRRRSAVKQALLPAYRLHDQMVVLQTILARAAEKAGIPLPQLTQEIQRLANDTAPDSLKRFVPPAFSPFTNLDDDLKELKSAWSGWATRAAVVSLLVRRGIEAALLFLETRPGPARAALKKIDGLVTSETVDSAGAQLATILNDLQRDPPVGAGAAAPMSVHPTVAMAALLTLPPDTATLELQITRESWAVWVTVAAVALATGYTILVQPNYGFGTEADYLKCFFWGLGSSVAGTQLEQVSHMLASNFGISIARP
jgi:hypothetical protein